MSEYAINLDNGYTDAGMFLAHLTAIFPNSGVLNSTALTVAAQTPTPDMTVKVSGSLLADQCLFITTSGSVYFGKNTASKNVTIQSNTSGVTKTDAIVAYIDLAGGVDNIATPNNPGALKFIAVRRAGVSTGTPTDGEIDTATGNMPWLKLATVSVTHNATAVSSVTDTRIATWISPAIYGPNNIPMSSVAGPKEIHIPFVAYSASNTSYSLVDPSRVTIEFSKLATGLTAAYFSATLNSGGAGTTSIKLYNVTNTVDITGGEATSVSTGATEIRTSDIKANLPTTSKLMAFQSKNSSGAYAIHSARLILQY